MFVRRCIIDKDCFSRTANAEFCKRLDKAIIKREEWKALPARDDQVNGIADKVIVHRAGPDTCKVIGLSGDNCQQCLRKETCIKELILALQNEDLSKNVILQYYRL